MTIYFSLLFCSPLKLNDAEDESMRTNTERQGDSAVNLTQGTTGLSLPQVTGDIYKVIIYAKRVVHVNTAL